MNDKRDDEGQELMEDGLRFFSGHYGLRDAMKNEMFGPLPS
jgi:hypothetical protein